MKIGYVRVSTNEQNIDLQINALKEKGVEQIFSDKVSGTVLNRPGLDDLLHQLRKGDVVIVWRLDRIARNHLHLLKLIESLSDKGVGFKSIREPLIDTTGHNASSKLLINLMGAFAQFERDLISERTHAGLDAARKRGQKLGTPAGIRKKNLLLVPKIKKLHKDGAFTIEEMLEIFKVSRGTFYKLLNVQDQETDEK